LKIESESGVQDFADQGFCRPRVLILCPFRGTALKVVESIKRILGDNTSMSNKDKFEEEFGPPDDDSEDGSEDERDSETAAGKNRKVGTDRPEDWKALFEGNAL
jgi:Utp25, U3 small nucleolar RNA-associated SSU processome protein 25